VWDRYVIRRKINSAARRAGLTWAPMLPFRAWIVSTGRCNLKCRHCRAHAPVHNYDPNWFTDMRPEIYERVRRELLPGLGVIHLSGGGEPFIAPIFYRMLDDMLDGQRYVGVVTNGTVIRPDILERLVSSPSLLRVSIDSTQPELMEYIRTGVKFERVMRFMETLKEIRSRIRDHPRFVLEISWVVTRSNVAQMTECVELAHRYKVHHVCFGNFVTDDRTDEFAMRESLMNRPEEVLPHWQRAHDRGRELGLAVYPIAFDCADRPAEERQEKKPDMYYEGRIRPCPVPWWAVYIELDGTVKPCCVFRYSFGNLAEQSFREIWNGPKFRDLRRTVNTPDMPETCKHCFIQERL